MFGDVSSGFVVNDFGVRVALHLNLKSLASELLGGDSLPPEPIYSITMSVTNNATNNALLFITSAAGDAFTYYVNAGNNTITFTMPNLVVGRLYVIRTYNATLSGTLTYSGEATVSSENGYYTFQCDTKDTTILLSGLTIS